jgi:hypothetical protein
MKFLAAPLLLAILTTSPVQAQELLYPAKYHVYKIVLKRRLSLKEGYKPVSSWDVDLLMITGNFKVLMYNTVNEGPYLKAVGAPSYRLSRIGYPYQFEENGIISEHHLNPEYSGRIVPPSEYVPDPARPVMKWRSTVSGSKSLNLDWETKTHAYELSFYCRPVE